LAESRRFSLKTGQPGKSSYPQSPNDQAAPKPPEFAGSLQAMPTASNKRSRAEHDDGRSGQNVEDTAEQKARKACS
jgi:hypothetical protein